MREYAGALDLDDAVLMRCNGYTYREIGEKYGISKQCVYQAMLENGVKTRREAKIYREIPYDGLYRYMRDNEQVSKTLFCALVFGNTNVKSIAKITRLMSGGDVRLTVGQIKRMEAATGMSFDDLFEERKV